MRTDLCGQSEGSVSKMPVEGDKMNFSQPGTALGVSFSWKPLGKISIGYKRTLSLLTHLLFSLPFLPFLFTGQVTAQENRPVFWTSGGEWGTWLKMSNFPGLAIRTACGDDTTLKNYPVSSEDWQLQNNYTAPMAVVWRVQFFNDSTGKNEMGGWMLEHLKAGQVSDGWVVAAGHCQARNIIRVQVKCAAREGKEDACYKDPTGNPYPLRSEYAYRGDHSPSSAAGSASAKSDESAKPALAYYYCIGQTNHTGMPFYPTAVFSHPVNKDDPTNYKLNDEYRAWLHAHYPETANDRNYNGHCLGGEWWATAAPAEAARQDDIKTHVKNFGDPMIPTSWTPPQP
jgi:hypothetical protein